MKYNRGEILPDVWLTAIHTDKFKTGTITLSLLSQLDEETASMYAVIPNVLRRGCASLPDMEKISAKLDELYGSRIEPICRRMGEIQASGFVASFPEDRLLPEDGELLRQITSIMGELLLRPNTRGGLFLPEYVNSERDKLVERIRSIVNDKAQYAMDRLIKLMCAYERISVGSLGSEETAAAIHYTKLTRAWRELIAHAPIEIFYCGSEGFDAVSEALRDALTGLPRGGTNYDIGTDIRMNSVEEKPREFSEEMDVTQGKLVMGWRLGESMLDPDLPALMVFNSVFGGSVTSKLFMNVRERLQLCYYASSGLDTQKGLMYVSSGVAFENLDAARDEIIEQLEAVKRGEISDEEISAARLAVSRRLMTYSDDPLSLESHYLNVNLMGLDASPEELAAACEGVGVDSVVEIAKNTELDAVYYLVRGEEADDEKA